MNLSNRKLAFVTLVMLVLLRTAIGWQFLYEGVTKLDSHWVGLRPWSSRGYLMMSTGPLAPVYRSIANPDPFGLERVTPTEIKNRWSDEVEDYIRDYKPSVDTARIAEASLEEAVRHLDAYFEKEGVRQKLMELREGIRQWEEMGEQKNLTYRENERELLRKRMIDLEEELAGPVDEIGTRLRNQLKSLLMGKEETMAPPPAPVTALQVVDWLNMIGLTVVGLFLLIGLFSRTSALVAAAFLLLYYLAMPPWPGLPEAPIAEGTYMIVNKNLVELVACLALATVPTGKWLGLDAVVSKILRRATYRSGGKKKR